MSKYSKLLKNTAWVFCGSVGCRTLQFLLLPYLTAWLTPAEYGVKDLLVIYATVLAGLFSFKIEDAVFFYAAGRNRQGRAGAFSLALSFTLVQSMIWGVILCIGGRIASPGSFFSEFWLWLFGITLGSVLFTLLQKFCRATDHMALYSLSGGVYTAITVAGALILIPRFRLQGYLAAILLGYFSGAFVLFAVLRPGVFWGRTAQRWIMLKKMLGYSFPVLLNTLIWIITTSFNRPLLAHWDSLEAVGLFAIANKIPLLLDSVWSIFFNSWQLSAVQEYHQPGFSRYFNRIAKLNWKIFIFACSLLTIGVVYYVPLFFGKAYYPVLRYIPLLLAGIVFSIFSGLWGSVFTASGKSKYFFYCAIITLAVSLLLNFGLIPAFGIWGAVWALTGTLFTQFLSRGYIAHRLVKLTDFGEGLIVWGAFVSILVAFYFVRLEILRRCIYGAALLLESYFLYRELKFLRKVSFLSKIPALFSLGR